jgi:hypothetical protein
MIRSSRRNKRRSWLAKVWFWIWMHGPLRPRRYSIPAVPAAICLVLGMDETIKVTLALGKDSVRFFKKQAKMQKVPYQRMIKNLVDRYASSYQGI